MGSNLPLIQLSQINKKYQVGDRWVPILQDISLTLNQGELVAVVGPSGSGKSTLMNLIGLLDNSDSGSYYLKGRDVAQLTSDQLAAERNLNIGFIFQQFNLLPRFTVTQNLQLPLIYRRENPVVMEKKINAVLEEVAMSAYASYKPTQLSGGQQQRVAIARALVGSPKIILADEPTGALDSKTGEEIMRLFLNLHSEGRTVILITHDKKVASLCHRIITIGDGMIASDVVNGY
jgi:putative ABC transport system ATP-binding protein